MSLRVYVAGPLHGSGTELNNVRRALHWAELLKSDDIYPFVPHLFSFWNMVLPHPGDWWLDLDLEWLEQCHALLRLPGESPGTEREVARMRQLGRPVFETKDYDPLLLPWANKERNRLRDLNLYDPAVPLLPIQCQPYVLPPVGGQMLPTVCLDPTKMNGYSDQFPCTD